MRKTKWLGILLAVALALIPASSVLAASSQDVTVTATPLYLAITNQTDDAGTTWLINGLGSGTATGLINTSTTYYAKPVNDGDDTTEPLETVVDGDCYFTVTCTTGATTCDLTVNWGDFADGGANMTNGDTGSAGATSYGAYSWYSGMTYTSKVIAKSSASDVLYSAGLAADASLKWGVEIATQTDGWSSGVSSTSTLTITATAH